MILQMNICFHFILASIMIWTLLLLAVAVSVSTSQRFGHPCGSLSNIENCVCNDVCNEEETEVTYPPLCRMWGQKLASCVCKDGTEWAPPTPPPGPCEDGSRDVESCTFDENSQTVNCICEDGSTFEPVRGGGRGRGGRGRGRGSGRGGFTGGNGPFGGNGGGQNGNGGGFRGRGRGNRGGRGGHRGNNRGQQRRPWLIQPAK